MDSLIQDGLAVYRMGAGPTALVMPGPHRYERPGLRCADAFHDHLVALGHQVVTFDPPGSGPPATRTCRWRRCTAAPMRPWTPLGGPVRSTRSGTVWPGSCCSPTHSPGPNGSPGSYWWAPAPAAGPTCELGGALWNRSHPGFWGLAPLGILNMVLPTRAPERLMNNYIERRSFHDEDLAEYDPVHLGDWGRARDGRPDWHWKVARHLDYRDRLGEIAIPCLVMCGRHDPQYPPDCAQELADGLPNARLVWVAHSGHYPQIEEPAAFSDALTSFLRDTRP